MTATPQANEQLSERPCLRRARLKINCYEYATNTKSDSSRNLINERSYHKAALRKVMSSPIQYNTRRFRRSITDLSFKNDIYKEHAKLVLDINSLKQTVYVPPVSEGNSDYDESIFHETIEMAPTTPNPISTTTTKFLRSSSFPIILLGGPPKKPLMKGQASNALKTTINLVGTTGSPMLKHPYPFVMETPHRPLRVCMPTMTLPSTNTKPSLWERLLKILMPR